jgi:hypothetical protein
VTVRRVIFTCLRCGYRDDFQSMGATPTRCPYGCRNDMLERHEYEFARDETPAMVTKRPPRRLPAITLGLRGPIGFVSA